MGVVGGLYGCGWSVWATVAVVGVSNGWSEGVREKGCHGWCNGCGQLSLYAWVDGHGSLGVKGVAD